MNIYGNQKHRSSYKIKLIEKLLVAFIKLSVKTIKFVVTIRLQKGLFVVEYN